MSLIPTVLEEDDVVRREHALQRKRLASVLVRTAVVWGLPLTILFCTAAYLLVDPPDPSLVIGRVFIPAMLGQLGMIGMCVVGAFLSKSSCNRWHLEEDRIRVRGEYTGTVKWRSIRRWSIEPHETMSGYCVLRIGRIGTLRYHLRLLLNDATYPRDEVERIFEERVSADARVPDPRVP